MVEAFAKLIDRMEVVLFLWQRSHMGSVVNERADLEAEVMTLRAAEGGRVEVVRVGEGARGDRLLEAVKVSHDQKYTGM